MRPFQRGTPLQPQRARQPHELVPGIRRAREPRLSFYLQSLEASAPRSWQQDGQSTAKRPSGQVPTRRPTGSYALGTCTFFASVTLRGIGKWISCSHLDRAGLGIRNLFQCRLIHNFPCCHCQFLRLCRFHPHTQISTHLQDPDRPHPWPMDHLSGKSCRGFDSHPLPPPAQVSCHITHQCDTITQHGTRQQ